MKKLILILSVFAVVAFGSCKKSDVTPDIPQFSLQDSCQCFKIQVNLTVFYSGKFYHSSYSYPLFIRDSIFHFCQTKDTTIQMRQDILTNYIKSGSSCQTDVVYTQVKCN